MEGKVLWMQPLSEYSQHFIVFVTYKQAQYVRVFVTGKHLKLGVMQQSSLLGWFISYIENKVSWIQPLGPYSQHFIFFVTYKQAQ